MDEDVPAESSSQRIVALLAGQEFTQAAALAGRLIAREPRNAKLWCLMTQAQLGQNRNEAALAAAHAASSISPHAGIPRSLASEALLRLGRNDDAVAAARDAVRFGPRSWETHHALSRSLFAVHAYNDARLAAEHAVKLAPNRPEPHLAAGRAARGQHRIREARNAFNRALAIDPENSVARRQLSPLRYRKPSVRGLSEMVNEFAESAPTSEYGHSDRRLVDLMLLNFMRGLVGLLVVARGLDVMLGLHARTATAVCLALAGLYAATVLIRLRRTARGRLAELLLGSRHLKAAGVVIAAAFALMLSSLLPGGATPSAGLGLAAAVVVGGTMIWMAQSNYMREAGIPGTDRAPRVRRRRLRLRRPD